MIGIEHELAQRGPGSRFRDTVSIDFCDGEEQIFGLLWVTRLPNAGSSRASVAVFAEGKLVELLDRDQQQVVDEWTAVELDGVRMATETPLERWSIELAEEAASMRLELTAAAPPVDLGGDELAVTTGIESYEQLCDVSGTLDIGGATRALSCVGRRVHSWGEFAWDRVERWRTLYAASQKGDAISVVAALPSSAAGHGEELLSARSLRSDTVAPFGDVRLSTVFGPNGLPATAGLELSVGDDDYPRRLGGESLCGTLAERERHTIGMSFLRWSLDGEPAYGLYEVVQRR